MERSSSFGTSWADQWDYSDHGGRGRTAAEEKKKSSGSGSGGGGWKGGVEKTKTAAAKGFKKVKEGTSNGFHWVKDKYKERTQKH